MQNIFYLESEPTQCCTIYHILFNRQSIIFDGATSINTGFHKMDVLILMKK